jgi:hypothetical protein
MRIVIDANVLLSGIFWGGIPCVSSTYGCANRSAVGGKGPDVSVDLSTATHRRGSMRRGGPRGATTFHSIDRPTTRPSPETAPIVRPTGTVSTMWAPRGPGQRSVTLGSESSIVQVSVLEVPAQERFLAGRAAPEGTPEDGQDDEPRDEEPPMERARPERVARCAHVEPSSGCTCERKIDPRSMVALRGGTGPDGKAPGIEEARHSTNRASFSGSLRPRSLDPDPAVDAVDRGRAWCLRIE